MQLLVDVVTDCRKCLQMPTTCLFVGSRANIRHTTMPEAVSAIASTLRWHLGCVWVMGCGLGTCIQLMTDSIPRAELLFVVCCLLLLVRSKGRWGVAMCMESGAISGIKPELSPGRPHRVEVLAVAAFWISEIYQGKAGSWSCLTQRGACVRCEIFWSDPLKVDASLRLI